MTLTSITRQAAGLGEASTPQKIGKYEILGLVGRGSSGLVYKGFDPFVRREVAVKIALHLQEEPKHLGGVDAPKHSFFTEARAAGMLNHAHIIALYDAGMEGDLCYIVMEYVDGDTLLPWTRKNGPRMKLSSCVELITSCAQALAYSHSRGVLHRDIKPSNIMLTSEAVPKIMDFSIAEVMGGGAENATTAVGSPLYMPPEQVMRQQLTPAADLYAIGAVAYQLLTGEPPFISTNLPGLFNLIRNQKAPDPREIRPELPEGLCGIINRLLAKKPDDRYPSGYLLAEDLQREFEHIRRLENAPMLPRGNRETLRSLPFFQHFTGPELDEVQAVSQLKQIAPGKPILDDDQETAALYVLITGQAILKKNGKPLYVLQKGDVFADDIDLPVRRRATTLTAASQLVALKISPHLITRLAAESQLRIYQSFTQSLVQRLGISRG